MGEKIKKVRIKRIIDSPLDDKSVMDDSDINILNNLISLSSGVNKEKSKKEKKHKKKSKKKDKKSKKKDKVKKPKLNLDALKIYEDDDVEKDKEEFYEQRFSSSLILLRDVLKEVNDNIVENKKYLNELKDGKIGEHRIKMSPMTISSQMTNIASLVNTKLSAIKQITDVNKSISDLELKKLSSDQKIHGTEDKEQNSKLMMDKVFDQLINFDMPDDPNIDDEKSVKTKKKKKFKNIDDRIDQLEKEGKIEFTDNEKAFKYENDGVEIVIRKDFDKNTWEFCAQNKKGDELFDYPLPDKKNIGRVKFDENNDFAKDALGQKYRVELI